VGEVLAMPIRSFANPGVFFEPDVIGLMSEALEAACKVLQYSAVQGLRAWSSANSGF
jgi:hypothetical protein